MQYQRNSTRRMCGDDNTRNNQIRITAEMSPFAASDSNGSLEYDCGNTTACGNSTSSASSRSGGCGCSGTRGNSTSSASSRSGGCGCSGTCGNSTSSASSRSGGCGCSGTCGNSTSSASSRSGSCGCSCGNSRSNTNDGCRNSCLRGSSLAMVYSPYQEFDNLYGTSEGLCRGTLFRDLDKPFCGGRR